MKRDGLQLRNRNRLLSTCQGENASLSREFNSQNKLPHVYLHLFRPHHIDLTFQKDIGKTNIRFWFNHLIRYFSRKKKEWQFKRKAQNLIFLGLEKTSTLDQSNHEKLGKKPKHKATARIFHIITRKKKIRVYSSIFFYATRFDQRKSLLKGSVYSYAKRHHARKKESHPRARPRNKKLQTMTVNNEKI